MRFSSLALGLVRDIFKNRSQLWIKNSLHFNLKSGYFFGTSINNSFKPQFSKKVKELKIKKVMADLKNKEILLPLQAAVKQKVCFKYP